MRLVYVSVPVDALKRSELKMLMEEAAALLDPAEWEPVFNHTARNLPEDDSQRFWKHVSKSMLLLGECDAVIFTPGWNYFPYWVCSVEFAAAIRSGKRCMYSWRDANGKLRLLEQDYDHIPPYPERREKHD